MAKLLREARLVLQAQSGDRDALESLLSSMQAPLLRYISGIVGSWGAEDVLQNVFLEICRNLKWLRAEGALRKALNRVDRERRRATALLYALLLLTFSFWAAMILAKDDHTGLPYGLAAVIGSVFAAGMIVSRASHDNTRTILKAIELLGEQNQNG